MSACIPAAGGGGGGVVRALVLRRMHVAHLQQRHSFKFNPCWCQLRACSKGLASVPAGKLPRDAIALFHSPCSSAATNAADITIVTDELAFNQLLAEVLRRDAEGVNGVVRDLQRVLKQKREELAPLLAAKNRIDAVVDGRYVPLLRFLTLIFLLVQFAVLFRWVFVVFDWNLVEPMTYFLGYTVVWLSIVFHCHYTREMTWEAMVDVVAQRRRARLYHNAGIDAVALARMQQKVQTIEAVLSRY
ncbi:hypothetical protein DQ04_12751000 [Trypanosoma grayi]|uniref:hypothetical protein n=1 Tax=Trypanosoma grayi TaxID=71804 RepID=UPI0004F4B230|nr:hypothetical protein DQ04_12751000 [Trypanosoma grayi]KEG06684.1 hypothetical protein DQ04_12751000 [Trypanosoma grayi]